MQAKYDSWQVSHVVGLPNSYSEFNIIDVDLVNDFGDKLLNQLSEIAGSKSNIVAYIDSCYHHTFASKFHAFSLIKNDLMVSPESLFENWEGKLSSDEISSLGIIVKKSAIIVQDSIFPCSLCCSGHPGER